MCTAFYGWKLYSQSNAVFIQVWKLKARTNWNTLPQREVLEAKSSAVVLLYSTDTVCDISTYERVSFSMMGVAKRSNCWLAGWKLRHSDGFPINCRTVFSPTRGRITLLQIQIVSKFQIFCQIIQESCRLYRQRNESLRADKIFCVNNNNEKRSHLVWCTK